MTTSSPPRFGEVILESLGAAPEFRDAIIGDLAQEFAARSERYGNRAARMWYYRETLRAVPHLARNWLSGARFKDARKLLNVVGLAYVITMVLRSFVGFASASMWWAAREALGLSVETPTSFIIPIAVVFTLLLPVFAGYVAASLSDDAPLVASAGTGIAWATLSLVTGLLVAPSFQVGLLVGLGLSMMLAFIGTIVGGMIAVKRGTSWTHLMS